MLGTGGAEYILNPETLVRAHVTHLTQALSQLVLKIRVRELKVENIIIEIIPRR
jgi:hypothetical protein